MWLMILNVVSLLLNSDMAIVQFSCLKYNPFLTFLIVFVWTTVSILLTFSLTGVLDKKLIEKKAWRAKFAKLKWVKKTSKAIKKGKKRFLVWLLRQKKVIIFLVVLTPGVPVVKSVAIVAARILKLKNALALIIVANTLRVLVVVCFVYSI